MRPARERQHALALPVAHFRALIDGDEIGLKSISAIHALVNDKTPGEFAQQVTLTRAATGDQRLFDWYRAASCGDKTAERVLTIVQLASADGPVVNAWRLSGAIPVRWSGPAFDALENALALEQLEIRYATVERADRD